MGKKNLSWVTPSGCIKKKLAVFFFFLTVNVISKWWLSRLVLHNSHGPWESHLFQLVQHEYTTWSMSQYLIHILRVPKERTLAPSRSLYPVTTWSSELHLSLMVRHLKVQLLACLMKLYICNQTDQPFFPLKKKKKSALQVGVGWMPWSWLWAAPASTSWRPKLGKKEISARLQSPPIYWTCCSPRHSLIQSCCSKS